MSERALHARHARDVGGHGRPARAGVRGARGGRRRVRRGSLRVGGGAFGAVAAFGLGTGGMACAAAAALTAPDLPVPFWVGHGSAVPAFVGADTLVLAVSSSGGTAETLTAAEKAVERGATVVAVGGAPSGALAALAADAGLPWCPTPWRSSSGRAAAVPRRAPRWGRPRWPCWSRWPAPGCGTDRAGAVRAAAANLARRRDALAGPGRRRRSVGAPARPHHPAGLRLGRRDRPWRRNGGRRR